MTKPVLQEVALGFEGLQGQDLIAAAMDSFPDQLALVSSFGTESAVLLHMAAEVDRDVPVIFLDTEKLFRPTRVYQERLSQHLRLTNVRQIRPSRLTLDEEDSSGALWSTDPDRCCAIRKVQPLTEALKGFSAWVTGRKSFQNADRDRAQTIESQEGRLVLSPLLGWSKSQLTAYFEKHALPRHPLEQEGYLSVGCYTCTTAIAHGEDARAGRWRGRSKTECGIHKPHQKLTV